MADVDRIVPLDELSDYKVSDRDPDIRGWDVLDSAGKKIGEVDRLLVDTGAMKVRYLDVDVDDDIVSGDRHILVPIGYARLDENDDHVFIDRLSSTQLASMPAYTNQPLTRDYEDELRRHYDSSHSSSTTGGDFYAHESYDDNRFYGARREGQENAERVTLSEEKLAVGKTEHQRGAVEVDKEVETHHVSKDIPVRREEVVVERHAANPGATGGRIEEEVIRVPVSEEELVVDKRVVPKEEIVVRKEEVVDHQHVEADLRREEAHIRKEGDVNVRDDRR
jgi:photosynthetic reaction center H subunit